jgi:hypothetical protein
MQPMKIFYLLACTLSTWLWMPLAKSDLPAGLTDRLRQTRALNIDTVVETQFRSAKPARGFKVVDPYDSLSSETVRSWQSADGRGSGVCALRFSGTDEEGYELRYFDSPATAATAGYKITHQGRCGSCSTLQDLAVYLDIPDLTKPARQCARRFGFARKKRCFEEKIGFTSYCAESWAYNARHTQKACRGTCIADYGLLNLLFHRYPGENVNEAGQLRPCLQCDEEQSGPGFKYSAGRTRRNSGIESAIPRPESEIYPVDHTAYFQ